MHQLRGMTKTRQAGAGDVPGMQTVRLAVRENRLLSATISDDEVIEAIEQSGRGWVAVEDERVVGFSIANGDEASIWALFVDPDSEGIGIGSELHSLAVRWLFEKGHERIQLSTDPGTRAEKFYELKGWVRKGFKGNGEVSFELSRFDFESLSS